MRQLFVMLLVEGVVGLCPVAASLAMAGELCIESAVNYTVGASPQSAFTADLDGDGDQDVAVANYGSDNVSVLKNNGTGVLGTPVNFPVGVGPDGVCAADLDGDGDQDLAVANWGSHSVAILKNNGDATFDAAVFYEVGTPHAIVAADLDGDGDLDLVAAEEGWPDVGSLSVLENNGDGTFMPVTEYPAGNNPYSVCAADLDGDGDLDLAAATYYGVGVSILKNNGDGSFALPVTYAAGTGRASVFAADLDKDGDQDLAIANYGSANVSVLMNNGDGTFAAAVHYAVGSLPWAVIATDLNGDGASDLAIANFGSANISILENIGDGTFASAVDKAVGASPRSVIAADLDADGDRELIAANSGSDDVSALENCLHIPQVIRVPLDQPTIQAGINAAVDGDTVLVAPGTYPEHLDFAGRGVVVMSSDGADVTTITRVVSGLPLARFQDQMSLRAVLQGFTLTDVYESNVIAISRADPIIRLNVFAGNRYGEGPVRMSESAALITENYFQWGIGRGMVDISGWPYSNDTARIIGNRFRGGHAIYIGNGPSVICRDNLIFDGGPYGITMANGGSQNVIANNTIYRMGGGVMCDAGSLHVIQNNVIVFNHGYGVYGGGVLAHNDVYGNQTDDYFGVLPDGGSIAADPLFCDVVSLNFYLSSLSPCVGAGIGGADIGAYGVGCTTSAPEQPVVQRIGIALPGDSVHVTDPTPSLSWGYFDQQSRPHTKSEIEVGTNADWSIAEMWQPPTLIGADTAIEYAGLPLIDGTTYYVRVRVFNDTLWSNWLVAPFRMNSVPSAPIPVTPPDFSVVLTGRPTLVASNASDPEGDARRYDFEVYRDGGLTQLAAYITGKVEGAGQTSWKTDSLTYENNMHWWRVRANDGYENGPWSEVFAFTVDAYNEPPTAVQLVSLPDGGTTSDLTPQFDWQKPTDPDPNASLTYKLVLGLDPGFVFKSEVSGLADTTLIWVTSLVVNQPYWWKVEANDGRGGTSTSPVWSFTTVVPCACDCHADPVCDGVKSDVLDIVSAIGFAFRGASPLVDPNVACPRLPADANCSGATDVVDVVKIVNVAFRGANAAMEYCEPCP